MKVLKDITPIVTTPDNKEVTLPATFFRPENEGITLLNNPLEYRCMLADKTGFFTVNGQEKGNQLKFTLINWRIEKDIRFSEKYKEPEDVIQAVIVDSNNFVATIVFRTRSMDNFIRLLDYISSEGKAAIEFRIIAKLVPKSNKDGDQFYVVEFGTEPNSEDNVRNIFEFIKMNTGIISGYRHLPAEDAEQQDKGTGEQEQKTE